jgi:hypothetical protein
MFALIDNEQITKHISGNKGITIGDVQYPRSIFTLWSEAERNAIGIFEITVDTTNKKDEQWYINTNVSYGVESNKAVGSYGTATAKAHADTLFTAQDEIDGKGTEGEVATRGLKYNLIQTVKAQAAGILQDTDWYIVRKADASTAVPSAITTFRAAVRTKAAAMETLITNASNTPAIETLYTYVNTADEGDPVVMERPLGEFPVLGS